MAHKIALLGIYHESNTFIDRPTTLEDFSKGHWLKGAAIRREYADAFHEIGGMLEVLDRENIEVIPVMYAEATPGGVITSGAYSQLLAEMMEGLDRVLPVDGCMVVPHGAAVSEAFPDMDGHWLSVLREKLGKDIPVIGTLDPHANVSPLMVASTDGLIAYKTNPHIDQREVGKEAANLMVGVLRGQLMPVQTLVQPPLAISIEQQYTAQNPCKDLYAYARQLSGQKQILAISIILGFPYADVREMGSSFIVIAEDSKDAGRQVGQQLASFVSERIDHFSGNKTDTAAALALLQQSAKPVLLLDMGDNVGGGSPGNSLHLLKALEHSGFRSFVCLQDPVAVQSVAKHPPGEVFVLSFNGMDGDHYQTEVTLQRMADGRFEEKEPRHGGQVNYDMGDMAILTTAKENVVMLTSLRVPPFSLKQLTTFGIFPRDFDVVVAKGVNAPIAAYGPECATIIQVDTPGVTRADMTTFTYKNRRKPLFPFEKINHQA